MRTIIIPIFCLLIGAIGLNMGISFWIRLIRYGRFPVVDGQLISSAVSEVRIRAFRGTGYTYFPIISYSYAVGATRFTSSQVYSISPYGHASRGSAQKLCDLLASKPSLIVYYNPAEPSFAFLRNGPGMLSVLLPILVGSVFIIVGLLCKR
jgi:hypothetical protein